ncbi:hypothetical protein KIF53_09505 [Chromobacterium subtsugae]|uniref:DnaT DNA-binding domain-containing protein n=1 Tax=Chromobacterium subtsugae TaxID=251747 RepID=A0ABS7FEX8_9NEIS|nr:MULTISPECIES: hypothetical protein [Chromobacterium]MBW7566282.1 hypothetical protein [Chromobacterium subtsugae]MBW8287859.1 hypothetical protein [Chromobacterium subtsugae]WSE91188.1 hypothetical protein U6115_20290 [Chromobacterium subtsugae]WVH59563.1 hypothetical protein U6151_20320 [Chromobacterium subtsugae]
MKRPSFQFYPADWLGNSNLRRCTHAEKGVWMDIMCLMHDSEEYGILRWSLKEIAQAVGCKLADLKSLQAKGVLKGSDTLLDEALTYTPVSGRRKGPMVTLIDITKGPLWYSSRMVIDEHKRMARSGTEGSPSDAPKPPFGEDIGDAPNPSPSRARPRAGGRPSSSTSSSLSQEPSGSFAREGFQERADEAGLTSAPVDLTPSLLHRGIAANQHLDLGNELAMFLANARAKGLMSADWDAQFELWLRRARSFGSGKDQQQAGQWSGAGHSGAKQAALGSVLNPPPRGLPSSEREIHGEVIQHAS